MTYLSRLKKSFEGAIRLPLHAQSKYVIISDCHRGIGNTNDNFIKNQPIYVAALKYYLRYGFTYIELGDGDELWENRHMEQIKDAHETIFCLIDDFDKQNRLYRLYGNHDITQKKNPHFHAGLILENTFSENAPIIFLTHGHQADLLNSTFWPLSRFLVRYFWKPLERYGIADPTSAAKNNLRKSKTENRLYRFAQKEHLRLIAGHTHRPLLSGEDLTYCNSGSCVHPYSITCIEIEHMHISLVKWNLSAGSDMYVHIDHTVLEGPIPLTYTPYNTQK